MSLGAAWLMLAGLWVGAALSGPWWAAPVALPLLAAAARRRRGGGGGAVLAVLALAVAGAGLAGGRAALVDRGPLPELARRGGTATLEATVAAYARPAPGGSWSVVRVTAVDDVRTRARAFARGSGGHPPGTRLRLRASARPLDHDGFEGYLRRMYAGTALDVRGTVDVVAPPGRLLGATAALRDRIRRASGRYLVRSDAALLAGLVTGDTTGLPAERSEAFVASGLSHLVAVSGGNVAIVLAGVFAFATVLGAGDRLRRAIAVVCLVWFTLLVGAEPSVLRAAAMASLVLIAGARGRGTDGRRVIAVAALLLLLIDPALAGQLGFALSVSAAAGVLILGPVLSERLAGPVWLRRLVGASVAAQVGVAPILLAAPDGLPVAAVPANLVAVPAAALASAVGMVVAVVAAASVDVAAVLAVAATPALRVVGWAATTFAGGPTLTWSDLLAPPVILLLLAGLCARRGPRVALALLSVAAVALVVPALRPPAAVDALTVTALDVGQGDALLLQTPADGPGAAATMLVDGGPDPGVLLRALADHRLRRLDAVALTHPHADHVDGLPAVLARLPVGVLLVAPGALDAGAPAADALAVAAAARRVPVVTVAAGDTFRLGGADVQVLGPPGDGSLGEDANENSLVLRVSAGGRSALLTGDAGPAAQRRLLRTPELVRADLLKVPHHGGDTNADGFLDAVGADQAIISVGDDNDYGHPHPDVLADLTGAQVHRTDTDGDVRIVLER